MKKLVYGWNELSKNGKNSQIQFSENGNLAQRASRFPENEEIRFTKDIWRRRGVQKELSYDALNSRWRSGPQEEEEGEQDSGEGIDFLSSSSTTFRPSWGVPAL